MMRNTTRRANGYARRKVKLGTHSNADEGPLAEGYAAGYRAAMRQVRRAWYSDSSLPMCKLLTNPGLLK